MASWRKDKAHETALTMSIPSDLGGSKSNKNAVVFDTPHH